MVVVDEAAFRDLPGPIAIYRAGLARLLGDLAGTMAHARRALELVREDDHLGRGARPPCSASRTGRAATSTRRPRRMPRPTSIFERAGYLSDVRRLHHHPGRHPDRAGPARATRCACTSGACSSRRGQGGRRCAARRTCTSGMSELLRERNDLDERPAHLRPSRDLGEENGLPQNPYRSRVAPARIRQAEGDLDGALELLDEAERRYSSDFSPTCDRSRPSGHGCGSPQGRLAEAWGWARERGCRADDELSYVREFEHVTLARLLLAQADARPSRPHVSTRRSGSWSAC